MTDTGKTRAQQLLGDTASELVRLTTTYCSATSWTIPDYPRGTAAW